MTVLADAMSLSEAVDRLKPDILVLDWELPGVRGDEALERLRTSDRGLLLPVFMLSNFPGTRAGAIDRAFSAGAIAWLQKVTTTPSELAAKLGQALGLPDRGTPDANDRR